MNTKHLKAKILDLAIRGKLVEQKAEDGNAFDLLQKIRDEKMSHGLDFANAKSRKNKQQTETALAKVEDAFASDLQFEIPENWCWCRLGEITTVKSSKRVFEKDYVKNGVPFYRSLEIGQLSKSGKCTETLFITRNHYEVLKKTNEMPTKGDILITSVGSIGNTWICDDREFYYKDGNVTQISKSDAFEPQFINFFLHSNSMYSQVSKTVGGSAYNALTIEKLKKLLIPLPPLPEQKRIVSAIEKAFEQIDIIEKNKLNLKTYIKQTKSKVLDLAIRGKLVEQNTEDGNAFDLLQKIRDEKTSHGLDFANAKSRKNKHQTETALAVSNPCDNKNETAFAKAEDAFASDLQFEIPKNWCWCRFDDLGDFVRGKGFIKSDFVENGFPCIHYGQIHMKFTYKTESELTYIPNSLVSKSSIATTDDVIIAITSEDEIGSCKSTVWKGQYNIAVGSHAAIFHHKINPLYIVYYMFSEVFHNQKTIYTHGGKVVEIKPSDIAKCYFPLPPLPEQKRIVAKIEQVFEQLDMLEKSLGE